MPVMRTRNCRSPLAGDAFEAASRAPPDISEATRLHVTRRSPLAGDAFEAAGRAPPDIGEATRLHMVCRSPLAGDAFCLEAEAEAKAKA